MKERTTKNGKKQVGISLFMKPELHRQLKESAEKNGITITVLLRQAAQAYLNDESILGGTTNAPMERLIAVIDHLANRIDHLNGGVEPEHSSH